MIYSPFKSFIDWWKGFHALCESTKSSKELLSLPMAEPTSDGAKRLREHLKLSLSDGSIWLAEDKYLVMSRNLMQKSDELPHVWENTAVEYDFNPTDKEFIALKAKR
jgi:hypothetical protein